MILHTLLPEIVEKCVVLNVNVYAPLKDKDGSRLEIIASFLGIKIKSSLKAYPEYFK